MNAHEKGMDIPSISEGESEVEKKLTPKEVVENIINSSKSLEEMGVSMEGAREAIRTTMLEEINNSTNRCFGTNQSVFGEGCRNLPKVLEIVGDSGEMLNDPEIRRLVVDEVIPTVIRRINEGWIKDLATEIKSVLNITPDEWTNGAVKANQIHGIDARFGINL